MPNNKKRSRIVSFRLSEEEYDSLKNVSETSGARSVSEFTRSAAFQNNDKLAIDAFEETLRALEKKIDLIDRSVNKLVKAYDKGATDYTDYHESKKGKKEELL